MTQWQCPVPVEYGAARTRSPLENGRHAPDTAHHEEEYNDDAEEYDHSANSAYDGYDACEYIEPPVEEPPDDEAVYISELPNVDPPQEYEHSLEDLAYMDMLDLDDAQTISEMLDWTINANM